MIQNMPNEEKAALIRTLISSRGWELYDAMLSQKFEQARDQAFLAEKDRHPDFKDWSMDKLTGIVTGLGFSRNVLQFWLNSWDAMERAASNPVAEAAPSGHPYANDPNPAGVAP